VRVFRPGTPDELAEWVEASAADFRAEGMPIVTGEWRERRSDDLRDLPRLGVSTRNMAEVLDFRPADLTITVQAGMRLAALERFVEEAGLWLPLAGAPSDRSVGGWIAAAPVGEYDESFGPLRRHVLACTLLLWSGTPTHWGRPVMKNVAGYDVTKLIGGSRARLGIVTEATLRLWPRSRAWRRFHLASAGDADRPPDLKGMPRAEGVRWRDGAGGHAPATLAVTLAGGSASVSGRAEALRQWAGERDWTVSEEDSGQPTRQITVTDSDPRPGTSAAYRITFGRRYLTPGLRDLTRRLEHELDPWSVEAYPGIGVVRLSTESQKAAGRRYAPAWLTTLAEPGARAAVPEPALERPAVRIERGGEAEHETARRMRSPGAREIESRWVSAFGGLHAPWQAEYL